MSITIPTSDQAHSRMHAERGWAWVRTTVATAGQEAVDLVVEHDDTDWAITQSCDRQFMVSGADMRGSELQEV